MSKTRARIIGVNRLIKRLKIVPDAVFDAAEEAITQHSSEIAAEATSLAPKDEGELATKIKARKTRKLKTKVRGSVYSGAPHSINVEYGTAEHSPQPFLRPAARKSQRLADMARRILAAFKKK
jgi:HK97 gp10 family phage protein